MPVAVVDLDALAAESGFSGVVRVDDVDRVVTERAFGLAHRGYAIPHEVDTRLAMASGSKGLTALAVMSLVEDGVLELATPARALLGDDLPLIRDDVTVEHLLAHRSGIGDYLDEEADLQLDAYLMPVPVHELATTEDYLAVLGGHETKFAPGARFSYSNGGYVVAALLAERAAGVPFHDLVTRRVCEPAGMRDTAFLRSDEPGGRTAVGYLSAGPDPRTNVFHLPVRGSGDGGAYTTAADMRAFWRAFFAGEIVPVERVAAMVAPRSEQADGRRGYGLGFWLDGDGARVELVGSDAGVSFWSAHEPRSGATVTVISNTTGGAWPVVRALLGRQ